MSTLGFVRRIFVKDVRLMRWLLLLLGALVVARAALRLDPAQARSGDLYVPAFLFSYMAMAVAITISAIQVDPSGREFRFLLTRPVPGTAVGVAKALFLGLFVLAPWWLGIEFDVACARMPLTLLDHVLLLVETMVWYGAALVAVTLCAVFLQSGIKAVLTVVSVPLVGLFVSTWLQQRSWHGGVLPHIPTVEQEHLSRFCNLLAAAVFLAGSLLAIGFRYRGRGFWKPLAVAAAAVPLSLLALRCPGNFLRFLDDQSSTRSMMKAEELGRIHMTLVSPAEDSHSYDINTTGWNDITYAYLNQEVRVEGVNLPYFIHTVGYHAIITLRSGRTIVSDFADCPNHGGLGGMDRTQRAIIAGVKPYWPPAKGDKTFDILDLLNYVPRNLGDEDLTGATVKGVITLDVRRGYVAGSMVVRPNASFAVHRSRYEITDVDSSNEELHVSMEHYEVPLTLRGDIEDWNSPNGIQLLPVYRPFDEQLNEGASRSSSVGGTPGLHRWSLSFDWEAGPWQNRRIANYNNAGWQPLPSGWVSGVELIFVGSDSCGHVALPYEIDNVDLRPGGSTVRPAASRAAHPAASATPAYSPPLPPAPNGLNSNP